MKLIFLLLAGLLTFSAFAQDDPYYGKIKLRKSHPVAFFVDIEATPEYVPGRLEEALYSNLNRPEPWDANDYETKGVVVMRTIIDEKGYVIHVEPRSKKSALTQEAKKSIEKLGRFIPHLLEDNPVPARFDIPFNFDW